jgi:hypothetical protein
MYDIDAKTKWKETTRKTKHRWVNIITMEPRGIECINYIDLA